jgi:hypothetical protein
MQLALPTIYTIGASQLSIKSFAIIINKTTIPFPNAVTKALPFMEENISCIKYVVKKRVQGDSFQIGEYYQLVIPIKTTKTPRSKDVLILEQFVQNIELSLLAYTI